jgi:HD superfamily phosphohydrolase
MQNAHEILKSCNKAVSENELMDSNCHSKEKIFHQSIRLAALMHDLGTFLFSHTTEGAYLQYSKNMRKKGEVKIEDHESLGSFIVENTNYEGGISLILLNHGYDPKIISKYMIGKGPSIFANQILHSEVDCDRMDYLLRDAHYTGLKYGSYDRDYLLYHFHLSQINNQDILTLKHNSIHCIEDFLVSRFSWYSQVIRSPRGAKYDAIAERICLYFLEKKLIYRYEELLDLIKNDSLHFFGIKDKLFINLIHKS